MTSVTDAPENPLPFGRSRSRRAGSGRAIGWLRANLFSSIPSTAISLLLIFLLAKACVSLVQWGYWNAIWTVPGNQTSACRAIRGVGACWAVIPEKYRFILFSLVLSLSLPLPFPRFLRVVPVALPGCLCGGGAALWGHPHFVIS